jgi:sterol desaturase/sphingolipid hydroxylase (fatty acid hydroxylase superfamily)
MSDLNVSAGHKYEPEKIRVPPIYSWPPRPLKALRYLLIDLLYPWGFVFLALAFPTWWYLTPAFTTMAHFEPGWIALLWLRNCAFLFLFAGGLHWYLHRRRAQGDTYRLNRRNLSSDNKLFLWRDQVRDNMFWSIVSGVTFWTGFEAISYWVYASGRLPVIDKPWYFIACIYSLFIWSTANFYVVHRVLHFPPIYKRVHELHHRNVDIGPWSGISMHPLEHLFYFSPFVLWWFVPVHPVIIILTGFYQALSPSLSHSGFDYLSLGKLRLQTGDWYHQLHHQYFNLNYGNTPTPFDRIFGSWHDGSKESLQAQKQRWRRRRRKSG